MAVIALKFNPVVVTAADTFLTTTDKVRLAGVFWECSGAVAGDTVQLKDFAGNLLWEVTQIAATLPAYQILWPKGLLANGLQITPPTHGTLFVYLLDSYLN